MSFRPPVKEKQSNYTNWPRKGLLAAIVGSITALIILSVRQFTPSPCEKLLREFVSREALPSKMAVGFDNSYSTFSDSIFFDIETYANDNNAFFDEVIQPMVLNLTEKVGSELSSVDKNLLLEYQKEALSRGEIINKEKYIHYLLTVDPSVPPFELTVNDICEVKYKMNLKYQQDLKDVLPPEMQNFLNDIIINCPEFNKFRKEPINGVVDFSKLLECISIKEDSLKLLRQKYDALFNAVNFGIPWLDKNGSIRFEPGDYSISGVDQLFIEAIIEEYEKKIREEPSFEYKIICTGYADPSPPRGIPYDGDNGSRYRNDYRPINFNSPGQAPLIPDELNSNLHLSYARAFSGASYLQRKMNILKDKRYNVQVSYNGAGVDISKGKSYRERRRIEFFMTKQRSN